MGSSSESEGEIIESREDTKAIAGPYNSAKDRIIDRRSNSAIPAASRSPSELYSRRNDRSPSPYRHPRGDKRKRHDKPLYDPREAHDRRRHDARTHHTYHDLDEPAQYGSMRNGYDHSRPSRDRKHDIPSRNRDRDRSRSPWRLGKDAERNGQQDKRRRDEPSRQSNETRTRESSKQPHISVRAQDDKRDPKRVKFDSVVKPPVEVPEPEPVPEPVDEEAEIERRRRERQAKREALLNKTKPSSLLTQALNVPTTVDFIPATPPIETPSRESRQGQSLSK
jgi:serine/threonine-protein kinase PRP4